MKKASVAVPFIDELEISTLLWEGENSSPQEVQRIIAKARQAKGLSLQEVAVLLQVEDSQLLADIFSASKEVKEQIYGKRVVLFAPLYISDYCINNCTYCGYQSNNSFKRHKLTQDQLIQEVKLLEQMGHKRIALEAGEHPVECGLDYVLECIDTIYNVKFGNGSIRRINVNIAATSVSDYQRLKRANIGTYILFQETYHAGAYNTVHVSGPKADYGWHTTAHHRAMSAGIEDVGFGVLFGLYDYKYEVLAMLQHVADLEASFGVGPHTISVPRLRPARGMSLSQYPYQVRDEDYLKIIAVLRLAVPYTGIILSTRETPALRDRLLDYGISQMSAGSCTGVGAYRDAAISSSNHENSAQFLVDDNRNVEDVLISICRSGYLPSFCTACYRQERKGNHFMGLAKTGEIQKMCQPNALLTFQEYLLEYASPENQQYGQEVIARHLASIKQPSIKKATEEKLARIKQGEQDLFF